MLPKTKLRGTVAVTLAWIIVVSILGQGVVLTVGAQVPSSDIVVDADGGGDYTSIQTAVNNAEPGDVIQVNAGTYEAGIYIDKPITLRGNAGTDAIGPADNAPVITAQGENVSGIILNEGASNTVIKGFEIRNSSFNNGTGGRGINFHGNNINNIVISDNYVHNVGWTAIVAAPPGNETASNYTVTNNRVADFATFGIRLANVDQIKITENQIEGTEGWPEWQNSTSSTVGILVASKLRVDSSFETTQIHISDNSISGHLWTGIGVHSWNTLNQSVVELNDVRVENNVISDTRIVRGVGVGSNGADAYLHNTTVSENQISVGNYGVGMFSNKDENYASISVESNNITAGEVGIYTLKSGSASEFVVADNVFGPSDHGVLVGNSTNALNTTVRRNSFGNQTGYAVFNDGTGVLNATNNWWGATDGPSSNDPENPVTDPVTGEPADGSGNVVSENVRFDPWLTDVSENKTTNRNVTVSLQPVNQNVSVNGTTTYDIVAEGLTNGVASYEFDLAVGNASAATFTEIDLVGTSAGDTLTEVTFGDKNGSVNVAAGSANHDNGVLATVTVSGETVGDTTLELSGVAVGDNDANAYTIKTVNNASVTVTENAAPTVVGNSPAKDLDNDGTYEDVNGDGSFDIVDVSAMFKNYDAQKVSGNPELFDFNGDGRVDIVDVNAIFQSAAES